MLYLKKKVEISRGFETKFYIKSWSVQGSQDQQINRNTQKNL